MKVVGEGKYRCRICIDLNVHLDPRMAWQRKADNNQQNDKTDYSVKNSLHDGTAIDRGAGLFHSTMLG